MTSKSSSRAQAHGDIGDGGGGVRDVVLSGPTTGGVCINTFVTGWGCEFCGYEIWMALRGCSPSVQCRFISANCPTVRIYASIGAVVWLSRHCACGSQRLDWGLGGRAGYSGGGVGGKLGRQISLNSTAKICDQCAFCKSHGCRQSWGTPLPAASVHRRHAPSLTGAWSSADLCNAPCWPPWEGSGAVPWSGSSGPCSGPSQGRGPVPRLLWQQCGEETAWVNQLPTKTMREAGKRRWGMFNRNPFEMKPPHVPCIKIKAAV